MLGLLQSRNQARLRGFLLLIQNFINDDLKALGRGKNSLNERLLEVLYNKTDSSFMTYFFILRY